MYLEIVNALLEETKGNMLQAAKECLEDAKEVVPVDTGELKQSGKTVVQGNSIEVVFDAPHAIYVHEIPTQPGYKFLEKSTSQNQSKYEKIILEGK